VLFRAGRAGSADVQSHAFDLLGITLTDLRTALADSRTTLAASGVGLMDFGWVTLVSATSVIGI
jgi:hypothetical protein